MKYLIICLLFLTGCSEEPVSKHSTNNPNVPVDLMFDNDGCKVYRFYDNGHYHYYANCSPGAFGTVSRSAGKTTYSADESIPTSPTDRR